MIFQTFPNIAWHKYKGQVSPRTPVSLWRDIFLKFCSSSVSQKCHNPLPGGAGLSQTSHLEHRPGSDHRSAELWLASGEKSSS